jgi:hypothetical protein
MSLLSLLMGHDGCAPTLPPETVRVKILLSLQFVHKVHW